MIIDDPALTRHPVTCGAAPARLTPLDHTAESGSGATLPALGTVVAFRLNRYSLNIETQSTYISNNIHCRLPEMSDMYRNISLVINIGISLGWCWFGIIFVLF
jgi:hypothetical protein